jgi:hypothetical protein
MIQLFNQATAEASIQAESKYVRRKENEFLWQASASDARPPLWERFRSEDSLIVTSHEISG